MSRFGEALQSELNGTDSRLAGIAVEAVSTEVTGTRFPDFFGDTTWSHRKGRIGRKTRHT